MKLDKKTDDIRQKLLNLFETLPEFKDLRMPKSQYLKLNSEQKENLNTLYSLYKEESKNGILKNKLENKTNNTLVKSNDWTKEELLHLLDYANQKDDRGFCAHHFDTFTDEFVNRSISSLKTKLKQINQMFPEFDLRNYGRSRFARKEDLEWIKETYTKKYEDFKKDIDAGIVAKKIDIFLNK